MGHTNSQQNKKLVPQKINKIDKPLANLIKMSRKQAQINKIRSKRGILYRIITEYFKNLYSKILEMDKFLDTCD
jgi:CTP-dependent riboflavin kinase